ncbi:MAG: hypothetical protein ACT4PU_08460 [Planctomycetota bacterium]
MKLVHEQERAHPILLGAGLALMFAMATLQIVESLSSPPRAAPAVRAAIVAGLVIGVACLVLGSRPKRSSTGTPQ